MLRTAVQKLQKTMLFNLKVFQNLPIIIFFMLPFNDAFCRIGVVYNFRICHRFWSLVRGCYFVVDAEIFI